MAELFLQVGPASQARQASFARQSFDQLLPGYSVPTEGGAARAGQLFGYGTGWGYDQQGLVGRLLIEELLRGQV